MRFIKKLFPAAILALCLIWLPRQTNAEIIDSGTCGSSITWSLDSEGTFTVSGTGTFGSSWDDSYEEPLDIRRSIKTVVIEDGITKLGRGAFTSCTGMVSVSLPDGITFIDDYAFADCSALPKITIPSSVKEIGISAFSDCENLTQVTLPTSLQRLGSQAFSYCENLTAIVLPEALTDIPYNAFYDCSSLTSVTVSDSVTTISEGAFSKCSSLTSINFPNGLTKIDTYAFSCCYALTQVDLPASLTNIGNHAFYGCGLTNITIPKGTKTIGAGAFSRCAALTEISVTEGSKYYRSMDGVLYDNDMTHLLQYPTAKTGSFVIPDGVTTIESEAFIACAGLTGIVLPDSLSFIGSSAFTLCEGLTEIILPNSLTWMGEYVFSGCSGLTKLVLSNSISQLDRYTFRGCTGLTELVIPESLVTLEAGVFEDCTGLTAILLPSTLQNIHNDAFFNSISHYLFAGTQEEWEAIHGKAYFVRKNDTITYNYVEGMDYHVFTGECDPLCDACGLTREIDQNAHTWDEGFASRKPTCKTPGTLKYACTVCATEKTEEFTDETAHNWRKGVCTWCSKKESNGTSTPPASNVDPDGDDKASTKQPDAQTTTDSSGGSDSGSPMATIAFIALAAGGIGVGGFFLKRKYGQ